MLAPEHEGTNHTTVLNTLQHVHSQILDAERPVVLISAAQ
jgi:hypothetical protein